jgi:IclR family pca regulon transcriptional regulator
MAETVQSVERAFAILETFDEENPSLSGSAIVAATGLARPTVYRLLQTLQSLGYVRRAHGRFELTARILRLGGGYLGRQALATRAQPSLDRLAEITGEHVALAVIDGDEAVCIGATFSPKSRLLAVALGIGQRVPVDRTSLGWVLLAHTVADGWPASVSDAGDWPERAALIREQGFAIADGSLESGLRAISVPVRDHEGTVVAALAVACNAGLVPLDQLEREFFPLMVNTAEELTELT